MSVLWGEDHLCHALCNYVSLQGDSTDFTCCFLLHAFSLRASLDMAMKTLRHFWDKPRLFGLLPLYKSLMFHAY